MNIEREHFTEKQVAITKTDTFLNGLMKREFPAGVKVKDPQKTWIRNRMGFSFKLKRWPLSFVVSGSMQVTDTKLFLDAGLSDTLISLAGGEQKIREVINKSLDELFPKPA